LRNLRIAGRFVDIVPLQRSVLASTCVYVTLKTCYLVCATGAALLHLASRSLTKSHCCFRCLSFHSERSSGPCCSNTSVPPFQCNKRRPVRCVLHIACSSVAVAAGITCNLAQSSYTPCFPVSSHVRSGVKLSWRVSKARESGNT
jgi:hypothetical protein